MDELNPLIQIIVTIVCSVLASSGVWTIISKRLDQNTASNKMLKGLGHSKIVETGMKYIDRGYITKDEYEDLYTYLYEPYKALGGNGSAERIMDEIKRLPIKSITEIRGDKNVKTPR